MLAAAIVRHAVAARLRGLPLAADRVFTDRTWPLDERSLPAWKVVSIDEAVEPQGLGEPTIQEHALQIELQGYARAVEGLDDRLDDLAEEALKALFRPSGTTGDDLDDLTGDVTLSQRRIERAMVGDGEAAMGMVLITVRAEYQTQSDTPDTFF